MTVESPVAAKQIILKALKGGFNYGLRIIQSVDSLSDGIVSLPRANVYREIQDLRAAGLIALSEARFDVDTRKPPDYFELTQPGDLRLRINCQIID